MALPNMAMIPSGYKPTKLYSVLPTPVVSDVEKVTNGDFSNGSTGWNIENTWTIAGGVANGNGANGGNQELIGSAGLTLGKTYSVSYEIKNYVSGIVRSQKPNGTDRSANGVYTETLTANAANVIFRGGSFYGSITNISAKEVLISDADFTVTRASSATRVNEQGLIETPEFIIGGDVITNGDFSDGGANWTLFNNTGTSTNITNGVLNIVSDGTATDASQSNVMIIGKQYKVTFDVIATNGAILANNTNSIIYDTSTTGSKVFYIVPDSSTFRLKRRSGVTDVTIDNISVVEVERDNIPRLDYTDGGCPVLLTEPQSTNLVTDSEDFSDSYWNAGTNCQVDSDFSISPDGTQNADKLTSITNTASRREATVSVSALTYKKASIWLKKGNVNSSSLTRLVVEGDATYGFADNLTITDNWVRYEVLVPNTDTSTSLTLRVYPTRQIGGTLGDEMLVWGAQFEELDYSTSYIPTYGAIASRASETVSDAGDVNTYNSTEGTLFVEIQGFEGEDESRYISLSDGSDLNSLRILYYSNGGTVFFRKNVNGVETSIATITSINQSELNKIAIRYNSTNFDIFSNGIKISTNLDSNTFPSETLNSLALSDWNGSAPFYGKTSQVQVFNTALSDYELELLTSGSTLYDSYEAMRLALNYNIQ